MYEGSYPRRMTSGQSIPGTGYFLFTRILTLGRWSSSGERGVVGLNPSAAVRPGTEMTNTGTDTNTDADYSGISGIRLLSSRVSCYSEYVDCVRFTSIHPCSSHLHAAHPICMQQTLRRARHIAASSSEPCSYAREP